MCGFFQVFARARKVDRERFEEALRSMKHRGPDATGAHHHLDPMSDDDGNPVYVSSGHQRLSILDLDPRSNQPFLRGRQSLIFNGEIYNFRELRCGLPEHLGPLCTTGDTEVLFQGLRWKGDTFLQDANGMWAFSYLDESVRAVLAGRDRHGKKPLFFFSDESHLILSSTALAIHRYLGMKPQLETDFENRYLVHGSAFPGGGDQTHWKNIRQVPAGHILRFDIASWKLGIERYFDLRKAALSPAPHDGDLAELFGDAVRARLVSDRKVGLLLSGGADSTLILSALHAMGLQDQVHCFIGETGRSEDAAYAKKCVEHLGIEASVVDLGYGKDTLSRVMRMCLHHEKPFPFLGSSIAMAEMYERVAEHDVRVVLDGTGGDEIFGGYWERYYPAAVGDAISSGDVDWLEESWKYAEGEKRLITQGALRRLTAGILGMRRFKPLQKRFSPASFTLGLHQAHVSSLDPLAGFRGTFEETVLRDVAPGGQLGEWIWHNDRNSMMSGVEGRSPLLDYRLIPFVGNGYGMKFRRQWNKYQLRRLFDALTPLPTQWRQQKQGFRWNGKAFLRENQNEILDRIAGSSYLNSRYDIKKYAIRAKKYERFMLSGVTLRLLCLAGLDAELGMSQA
jgi:asparagine synthase (glutamine-hydrolysing)